MTISTNASRWNYTGDAVTTAFAYTSKIFASGDLKVYLAGVLRAAGYTVSGVGAAGGGAVTFAAAPANGVSVQIVREVPYTQETDLVDGGPFPADATEVALDKATILAQQAKDRTDRALRQPDSDTDNVAALPDKATRLSKFLAFDGSGNPIAAAGTSANLGPVSAYIDTLLPAASAAAARATLGVGYGVGLQAEGSTKIAVDPSYLRGFLSGLTVTNDGTDPTNDIGLAVGVAVDSTNTVLMKLVSALIKRLDAGWVAGTNQGMRNSAVAIANTTYHVYLVAKALGADPDIYAHTSAVVATVLAALQAEAGGASYIYARRIFSIMRVSAAIKPFKHRGDQVFWDTPAQDASGAAISEASRTSITLSTPAGIKVEAICNIGVDPNAGTAGIIMPSDLDMADPGQPSNVATGLMGVGGNHAAGGRSYSKVRVWTNLNSAIGLRGAVAGITGGVTTIGYNDTRGRFD